MLGIDLSQQNKPDADTLEKALDMSLWIYMSNLNNMFEKDFISQKYANLVKFPFGNEREPLQKRFGAVLDKSTRTLYLSFPGLSYPKVDENEVVNMLANDVELVDNSSIFYDEALSDVEVGITSGVLERWMGIHDKCMQIVEGCIKEFFIKRVVFCGHSIGGAMAMIGALSVATMPGVVAKAIKVDAYTFGAPAVGDAAFVKLFNERVRTSVRVVAAFDSIASDTSASTKHVKGLITMMVANDKEEEDASAAHGIETYYTGINVDSLVGNGPWWLSTPLLLLLVVLSVLMSLLAVAKSRR